VKLVNSVRAMAVLESAGIDAVVVSRPENVRYLTDLPLDLAASLDLPLGVILRRHPFELAALVAPRVMAGSIPTSLIDPALVHLYGGFFVAGEPATGLGPEEAAALSWLRTAPGEGEAFSVALGSAMTNVLGRGSHVAFDREDVAHGPGAEAYRLADGGDALMRRIRLVKTPLEIERLSRVAAITEEVEEVLMSRAVPGADWADLAAAVPLLAAERGAVPGFFTGGAGWQAGFVYAPQPMILSKGQLVRLDLGMSYLGYWSDTGRTLSIGEPSQIVIDRYHAIRSGVIAALDAIRPGEPFGAAFAAAMATVRTTIPGYQRHHCGHAIGLRAYEGELVAEGNTTTFEPGMVLNIEVPYYEIGWGGMQLEETVVVTESGHEALTRLGRDLFIQA
jgi:Xaa-Pro aminopeptidase